MPKIAVLLSSYNGEKYIEEQISSILRQKNVDVELYIRDDGSEDKTVKIIKRLMKDNLNIHLTCGENLGYEESFMKLIYEIVPKTDYYAFADQDDIWLDEKLIVGIRKIEQEEQPAMYYSHLCEVDEYLNPMEQERKKLYPPYKQEALFSIYVSGCTIIFNHKAMELLKIYRIEKRTPHDFWIGLICTYFGKVIYDETSYILYRKHENTVTHSGENFYMKLIKELLCGKVRNNYAIYLLKGYSGMMDNETVSSLRKIANYDKSIKNKIYAMRKVKKTTLKGTILLKLCILFNRVEVETSI